MDNEEITLYSLAWKVIAAVACTFILCVSTCESLRNSSNERKFRVCVENANTDVQFTMCRIGGLK